MVQLRIQGLSELGLGLGLGLGLAEVEWTQCSPKESLNVNTNILTLAGHLQSIQGNG